MKLKGHPQARQTCSFCPKLCRHACPAAESERSEEATPTFKQQVALLAADGRHRLDAERARVLYKCADCGATVDSCRHRVDVGASLRDARAQAVREGVAPPEVDWLRERFAQRGSPYGADLRQALDEALPGARRPRGTVGLFPGCTALAHGMDEVRAAQEVLERAGLDVPLALPSPVCCGYPLDSAGLSEEFEVQAHRVAASLEGFQRIVTLGPACAWTLLARYPQVGVRPRFQTGPLVDLLAEHTGRWRDLARPDPERRYAYHDPCFLGRRLGRYEEPRAVLRAALGSDPLELGLHHGESACSGGGGVYPLTHREASGGCAQRALDLFRETRADVLVTACSTARRQLQAADPEADVRHLVTVLAERTRPA